MYAENGEGSYWGGREGLPVFSNCLWNSTAGLSPRCTWGTHVSSTIVDGEHVFGHSLDYSPPVFHCHRGTCPWNSLSNLIGGPHIQMLMLFIWGGDYRTSYSYQRAYSWKAKRGEVPCGAQREPPGGLLPRFQSSPGHQAEVFWGTSPYFWSRGIPWPLWSLLGDGHMCHLLDSEIYKIQEVWNGQRDLWYANYVLKS